MWLSLTDYGKLGQSMSKEEFETSSEVGTNLEVGYSQK